jgi:hypothetical protein
MRRSGYSFPEVLFAVVVLGIGFIMIAAIFPVAISQSKATMDETTASALVRDAVSTLGQTVRDNGVVNPPAMIATGTQMNPNTIWASQVAPFCIPNGWLATRGSLISRDNPRFAYVPLYRRDGNPQLPVANQPPPQPSPADSAQIFVILVQCRALQRPGGLSATMNASNVQVPARTELSFDQFDVGIDPTAGANNIAPIYNPNNLYPHQVQIQLTYGGGNAPSIMTVNPTRSDNTNNVAAQNLPDAIAAGAYIILADATNPTSQAQTNIVKSQRGRIYRVGVERPDLVPAVSMPVTGGGTVNYPVAWELQPGSDMLSANENTQPNGTYINAWVVGRERLPDGTFTGPAQDVGFYTTFISATK